ncbi:hypothetical protein LINGRAPRIM_LOCUS2565 [Linum grandiflorum]
MCSELDHYFEWRCQSSSCQCWCF